MSFLLDTNVVSELRKAKSGRANPNVVRWSVSVPLEALYISVVTVLEIEIGILRLERRDEIQSALLRRWLEGQVLTGFESRILSIETRTAIHCARLHVPDPRSERDALIAASAIENGLTVVTRNVSDFSGLGVELIDPWAFGEMSG